MRHHFTTRSGTHCSVEKRTRWNCLDRFDAAASQAPRAVVTARLPFLCKRVLRIIMRKHWLDPPLGEGAKAVGKKGEQV